jgi:hypothetical protein
MQTPYLRYRPTRTGDGRGGFSITLGTASNLWGFIRLHEDQVTLVCDAREDVMPEDIVVADEDPAKSPQYRVVGRRWLAGAADCELLLERVQRPIVAR